MRPDAMVNCGNALSELAGLVDRPEEALKFLGEAVEAYRSGLAQEEDAMVRTAKHPQPPLHTLVSPSL